MNGIITLLLLGFFLLIPIVMVVVIIGRVIKKGIGVSGIKKEVEQNGWSYDKNGKDSVLISILQNGFFSLRKGTHRIRDIVSFKTSLKQAWVANYHFSSPSGSGHRRGGDYTLAIIERSSPGQEVVVVPKQSGVLAKMAEAASDSFQSLDSKEWDWILVSSKDSFNSLRLQVGSSDKLKNLLFEGNSLVFTKNHIVLSVQQAYTEKVKMYAMIEDIRAIDKLM